MTSPDSLPGIPASPTSPRRGLRLALLGSILLLAALVGVWIVRTRQRQTTQPPSSPSSPYRNTGPDAHYVGSSACRSCHEEQTASFRRIGMGRSMTLVDPEQQPPDAVFDHPASKRYYQVRRKDGALWHRELLHTEKPPEVPLSEFPLKYVVGSGRHALTYLVETDGFMVESPLTWYASRQAWGMSPGYDKPQHLGFTRAVGEACLYCHAGQAEVVGRSLHRMHITEAAIGCERCHGPGSLHVQRHEKPQLDDRTREEIDCTIVNPAHLSRDLAEAVCQQCHLHSVAVVAARGRKLSDFRPGLRLQDFRHVYVFEGAEQSMTVVGHVEQMHLSRCYRGSDTLSCLTCHDPHGEPAAAERTAYYKAICLNCHSPERCTVEKAQRAQKSPNNDCVHCHMPRSPTDIPHLAFTHHRIGIHRRSDPASGAPAGVEDKLRAFLEPPPLSDADRKRSLGLAYLRVSLREDAASVRQYQERALKLLSEAREAGLRDPEADADLAQLCFDMGVGGGLKYAESALADPALAGQGRCDALLVLAQEQGKQGNYATALAAFGELTELRRHALDWLLLATCKRALGEGDAAEETLAVAARINPRLWNVHRHLAEYYRQRGDAARAAWHQQRAVP